MDLILYNSRVVTMDKALPFAESIAIRDGKIVAVGSNEEVLALRTDKTKVHNLSGKLIVPGFNDSHMHLLNYGYSLQVVNLESCHTIDELIENVRDFIRINNISADKWVRGMRFNQEDLQEKRLPTKADLDRISTVHPIILSRVCGHVIIANSKAMELADVNKLTEKVKGGEIYLDEQGEPNGIFSENALRLIYKHITAPSKEDIKGMILSAIQDLLTKGITSVQSDDLRTFTDSSATVLEAFKELRAEHSLAIRVNEQCNLADMSALTEFLQQSDIYGAGDEFFRIGPLKLLADGSLGGRTAYLNEPYSDDPTTSGIPVYTEEELDELVITAHNANMQVAIHAIGDKTMDMAFSSIEKAQKHSRKNIRHAIIHCQLTDKSLLDKFRELDVIAHIQPLFVATDLHFVEKRIGKERAKTSYNWKYLYDHGTHLACGSDCPVETPNVLQGIYAAVTRQDLKSYPAGGWLPEQKMTIDEILYCYTMGSAYATYEENIKGSVTPGKLADIAVLSEDIYTIEPAKIKDVEVYMTIVDGKIMYNKKVTM